MSGTFAYPYTLLLAGSARSGSSILYRLLASHECVEARYEPWPLYALISYLKQIEEESFHYLWQSYLEFEVGVQSLAGRGLNLHKADISSAHSFITQGEIERRLTQSIGEKDLLKNLKGTSLLVKLVGVVPKLADLQRIVGFDWVWIGRNPASILASLISRRWFSDEIVFSNEFPDTLYGRLPTPFWLNPEDGELFLTGSEIDRCVLYITAMQSIGAGRDARLMVNYDRLCADPTQVTGAIESRLGLRPGPLTQQVVESLSASGAPSLEDFGLNVRQKELLMEEWQQWQEKEASFYSKGS